MKQHWSGGFFFYPTSLSLGHKINPTWTYHLWRQQQKPKYTDGNFGAKCQATTNPYGYGRNAIKYT